jgi:hypothetical protein
VSTTTYTKKSVTIPADLIEQADGLMTDGQSFSAYVTIALRRQIERDRLSEFIDELDAVNGPADPREVERWRAGLR